MRISTAAGVLAAIMLLVAATILVTQHRGSQRVGSPASHGNSIAVVEAHPAAIRFGPAAPGPGVAITAPPPDTPSGLFPQSETAFTPTGLAPDAQRVLDITALQLSLARYRAAHQRYPPALADLFPADAPLDVHGQPLPGAPVDPKTKKPYDYRIGADGSNYNLAATLSSGKAFTGFPSP